MDATFYISIFSTVCFVSSEILPFLPTKGNGLFHSVIEYLSSKNTIVPTSFTNLEEINKKLDKIIVIIDKNEI